MEVIITLSNLRDKTEQEVFTYIVKHLLSQNEKSEDKIYHKCLYHNNDGLKCAIGCLITDEEYNTEFESKSWGTLVNKYSFTREHSGLLKDLQVIHDAYEPTSWRRELRKLGIKRKLKITDI